jgi:hypothetical protein
MENIGTPNTRQKEAIKRARTHLAQLVSDLNDVPPSGTCGALMDLLVVAEHMVNGNSLWFGVMFATDRVEWLFRLTQVQQHIAEGLADQIRRDAPVPSLRQGDDV